MREQIITRDIVADPRSRYGNARSATRHFIIQRISGAINIAFIALLIFIVVRVAGQDRAGVIETLGNGWIGIPFALLLGVVCIHMRIGMREIIEDYIHDGRLHRLCLSLNSFAAIAIGAVGIVSLLKLVFWG